MNSVSGPSLNSISRSHCKEIIAATATDLKNLASVGRMEFGVVRALTTFGSRVVDGTLCSLVSTGLKRRRKPPFGGAPLRDVFGHTHTNAAQERHTPPVATQNSRACLNLPYPTHPPYPTLPYPTHPPTHARTHARTHGRTRARTRARTLSLTQVLPRSLTRSPAHSSLPPFLAFLPLLTFSPTHASTHSLTRPLAHALSHSRTHTYSPADCKIDEDTSCNLVSSLALREQTNICLTVSTADLLSLEPISYMAAHEFILNSNRLCRSFPMRSFCIACGPVFESLEGPGECFAHGCLAPIWQCSSMSCKPLSHRCGHICSCWFPRQNPFRQTS